MRLDGRLGGHLVQGHVDGTGRIASREPSQHWEVVRVVPAGGPRPLRRATRARSPSTASRSPSPRWTTTSFTVSLIPTTLELTTLGRKQAGDPVNLEVDVVAKYVERLMPPLAPPTQHPMPKDPA